LTVYRPLRSIAAAVGTALFTHASIIGGSIEKAVTERAVIPWSRPSCLVVTTVTPLARWPTTCRNRSVSTASAVCT
jgi:hypothetical protein